MTKRNDPILFRDADETMRTALVVKLNVPGRHRLTERSIHIGRDGFTIVAMDDGKPVGVISVCWKTVPVASSDFREAYIDLIDVDPEHRREGIARSLVELAVKRATEAGAYQVRAWTSESPERAAALAMWRALGFVICPTEILAGPQAVRIRGCFVARRLIGH